MTYRTACPDFSLLSQFLDRELGEEEEEQISRHLEVCSACRTKVEHMQRAEEMLLAELTSSPVRLSRRVSSPECLSPEVVSAYVQRVLSAEDGIRVEKHLQACDACVNEVMEAFRISSSLASTKRAPVPATLKERVAALWESPRTEKPSVSFSRLVIQLAQKGLQLLEQHLAPPLLDVQEIFAPAPAFRSGEGPSALNLRITAGQTEIRVVAIQEGEGIALTMTFLDSAQEVLAGERIFLRQHGKSIFSTRTDREGVLRTPRLEPGIYEVACPRISTTFQLELRS